MTAGRARTPLGRLLAVLRARRAARLPLDVGTAELRDTLGRRVVRHGPSVVEAPGVRALLGLP
ncbi:MAG TPA: hypothetical protein VNU66_00665 [Mycobacteriales bacterium]|nr:hypothetical protein [Mycobacteriales bacterium]